MTLPTSTTIQAAYDAVCSEIAKLEGVKTALERAGVSKGVLVSPKAQNAPKAKGKAPTGTLEQGILSVLDKKQAKTNAQIRDSLKSKGYAYSLAPLHVTKTLIRLSDSKRVKRIGKSPKVSYLLP